MNFLMDRLEKIEIKAKKVEKELEEKKIVNKENKNNKN